MNVYCLSHPVCGILVVAAVAKTQPKCPSTDEWINKMCCVFVWVSFQHKQAIPAWDWTPAGYLRFQLNSDTVYLEIGSDSTGEGFSSTRLPSITDTSQKPRLLSMLLTGYESEVPRCLCFDLINLLEQLTELRKIHLLTRLSIDYKGH